MLKGTSIFSKVSEAEWKFLKNSHSFIVNWLVIPCVEVAKMLSSRKIINYIVEMKWKITWVNIEWFQVNKLSRFKEAKGEWKFFEMIFPFFVFFSSNLIGFPSLQREKSRKLKNRSTHYRSIEVDRAIVNSWNSSLFNARFDVKWFNLCC